MSNALQIMHSPRQRSGDGQDALGVLDRQLAQLTRIVEDLLDATRIAQGKIELRRERLDLNDVLSAAVETSRATLQAYGHRFDMALCSDATYVDADPLRLAQVLVNLLNNAAKFTPRNGDIVLSCRRAVEDGRELAIVSVRDSGIGMAPELIAHVFDLFTQGDTFENHRLGGLGIGLTLARTLTELHNGTIEAKSDGAGRGSEFLIRLPLADTQTAGGPAKKRTEAKRQKFASHRILVIEDNADQAQSLAALLTLWGHEVKTAPEGMAGIAIAEEFKPEIALVDIGLPGISGYQVARLFRANEKLRDTRLIAQTGWGQIRDRARAKEAGFDDHMVKPLDPLELERLLIPRNGDGKDS
jgi:CheY-like chemotaxis protein/two-component sensor histidine kinase